MNIIKYLSLLLMLLTFVLPSCGDKKAEYEVYQKVSGVTWPTLDNASAWRHLWDGKSWIVALARDHQQLKDRNVLQRQLAFSLVRTMQERDPDLVIGSDLQVRAAQLVKAHIVEIRNLEKTLITGHAPFPVFGFGTLSLRGGFGGLQQLLMASAGMAEQLRNFDEQKRNSYLLEFMWESLERTPGVEFAEPDLESQTQATPAEIQTSLKNQWNSNVIGVADLVPLMAQSGQAVVAVIDTGVDNALDATGSPLEGRFFKNPGEDPARGKREASDDDGNGWVDDFMGIDATIPKGDADNSPSPRPGSNDVGGKGARCEDIGTKNSSSCGHGTHVAGIIAGYAQSGGLSYSGVCPLNCQILPIRAARRCFGPRNQPDALCQPAEEAGSFNPEQQREFDGGITDSSQLRALAYILDLESPTSPGNLATNVVNLSIGKYFSSRSLSLISRRLIQNDVLMVAAAGNQNVEVPMFPAAYRDVVAVCATSKAPGEREPTGSSDPSKGSADSRGERFKARYSNYGDWVDICAPGTQILSSVPGGDVDFKSGTSQASPHVSGIAGLIKALRPSLSAMEIRALLIKYSDFDFLYGLLPTGARVNADFEYSPYPDVKVFLLGAGELSAVNILYALTDPAKARPSQASSAIESGDTSQVKEGCIVSNLAADHPLKNLERTTSMPFILLLAYFILRFGRFFARTKKPGV
jgi:subtilisin family serine protease